MSFSKVLVANRGEIARRIGRSLRDLGLGWIAVTAPDEPDAPHALGADSVLQVPRYLDGAALIAAAKASGAEAIHPGYGFLAESAAFAREVEAAGLVWIGPPPSAMEVMADKGAAKALMLQAGVPCLPGYRSADQGPASLRAAGEALGVPLMVKAAAGGGGRGMRLVHDLAELPEALERARSEALKAFGNGELILERALLGARHVEVQVFADRHGGAIHLFERDCSLQRRHQKIVEEGPAPELAAEIRAEMGAAAVAAARACGYLGAGTVEFLVDSKGFYFLEMNTRLQVEHPVTEAITGLDLVALQILVAQGGQLPAQSEVRLSGHAIEARLCAEDPASGFLPQTGRILRWTPPPLMAGLRVDHALRDGQTIGTGYDSLLAKLIAWGPDRATARRRLIAALRQTRLMGLATNRELLIALLEAPEFVVAGHDTGFLDQSFDDPSLHPQPVALSTLLAAAALFAHRRAGSEGFGTPRFGWSSGPALTRQVQFETASGFRSLPVRLARVAEGLRAQAEGEEVVLLGIEAEQLRLREGGQERRVAYAFDGRDKLWLGSDWLLDVTHAPAAKFGAAGGDGVIRAPMAGSLIAVHAEDGADVEAGAVVAVIEAMKMEQPIRSPKAGRVTGLAARAGQQVSARQILMRIEGEVA